MTGNSVFLLCSILLVVSNEPERGHVKRDVVFLLLLPFEVPESSEQPWFRAGAIIQPAAELAVEQINKKEDVLPGYSVSLTVANSACQLKVHTVVNFVTNFFYSDLRFAGIVGPMCSDAVRLISPITGQENVSVLNFHVGSSEQFSDRNRYRYAFSTVSSTNIVIGLFVHLMRENGWDTVAVLYEQETAVFLNAYDLLVEQLPQIYPRGKISFSAPVSHKSLPLSSIIDQHLRVVIVISSESLAHKIVCLIQKRYHQLTFPSHQLVIIGNYPFFHKRISFILDGQQYECSVRETTQAMEGYLLTYLALSVANSTVLESGMTFGEYFEVYKQRVNGSTVQYANAIYDGVWSLALALNNSSPRLTDIGLDVVDYTYGHQDATDIMREEVLKLSFQGASGHISRQWVYQWLSSPLSGGGEYYCPDC